ncbi:MAG: hypothetical protein QG650_705 [Patescibacteria group bacterium]|nr:hypothetical protein [Patescibacteria group bacterium]
MTYRFEPRKTTVSALAIFSIFLASSCSIPSFLSGGSASKTSESTGNSCGCEDKSGKYGPKGEKCGEVTEEKVGRQGYYGELEKSKRPAYFILDCKNAP